MKKSRTKLKSEDPRISNAFEKSAAEGNERDEVITLESPVISAAPPDVLVDN